MACSWIKFNKLKIMIVCIIFMKWTIVEIHAKAGKKAVMIIYECINVYKQHEKEKERKTDEKHMR